MTVLLVCRDGGHAERTVDFLDDGNCRIRAISPTGSSTRSSACRSSRCTRTGPHARLRRSRSLQPEASISRPTPRLNASRQAVASSGWRARNAREPTSCLTSLPRTSPSSPDALAFNDAGDLYIWNFSPKVIFRLTPTGKLTELTGVSYATQLTARSERHDPRRHTRRRDPRASPPPAFVAFYDVVPKRVAGIHWGRDQGFQENGIAVTKTGTIYVDNAAGQRLRRRHRAGPDQSRQACRAGPDPHTADGDPAEARRARIPGLPISGGAQSAWLWACIVPER